MDQEMGREPKAYTFSEGALAHLACFMDQVAGLPGDRPGHPLWMKQIVLGPDDYWYRVEVKVERLYKASDPGFCEEDYPEHIYPDLQEPVPMAPTGSRCFTSGFSVSAPDECCSLGRSIK